MKNTQIIICIKCGKKKLQIILGIPIQILKQPKVKDFKFLPETSDIWQNIQYKLKNKEIKIGNIQSQQNGKSRRVIR